MHHILGNKVLEYDVDDRGVIVDEREIDRTVNPKPNIADWVKEHMVFWYDMSKPVDTYIPGVTYANPFVNNGGKLTYDNTINKCTITHTPTNNNNIALARLTIIADGLVQLSTTPSGSIPSLPRKLTDSPSRI